LHQSIDLSASQHHYGNNNHQWNISRAHTFSVA
jgi:hypothetical protein